MEFIIEFEYEKTDGGYLIHKTITRGEFVERDDMFLSDRKAKEFVEYHEKNSQKEGQ